MVAIIIVRAGISDKTTLEYFTINGVVMNNIVEKKAIFLSYIDFININHSMVESKMQNTIVNLAEKTETPKK